MVLVLGLSFFIFFTRSNPFRPGIIRSQITRIYFSLLFVKCFRASKESLKVKTEIPPSTPRKASANRMLMSESSSTIPTIPSLGDICPDSKDAHTMSSRHEDFKASKTYFIEIQSDCYFKSPFYV